MTFARAIVRPPGSNFASGLTCAALGAPDFERAMEQHHAYCDALRACGLELTTLAAELAFPDGTFVEDAAIVTPHAAILSRPGADTRRGEIDTVGRALDAFFPDKLRIEAPGTVDGGDVCEADGHFLIGVSARTNEAGAQQLEWHLRQLGHSADRVDIRASKTLLHLKTGIAYVGDGIWVIGADAERELGPLDRFGIRDIVPVCPGEGYAANCVRINDVVLVPSGYPRTADALASRGLSLRCLEMSEYQKMDGGLSCLSLRF